METHDMKTLNDFITAARMEEFAGLCEAWIQFRCRAAIPGFQT